MRHREACGRRPCEFMNRIKCVALGLMLTVSACSGRITQSLNPKPATATLLTVSQPLSALPSFADERGGGLFIDLAGQVVRLRADGTQAALESHPANTVVPGPASALYRAGPTTALVVTNKGLFIADSGWLVQTSWSSALSAEGLVGTALADDGSLWVAHAKGLFQVQGGGLRELTVGNKSLEGLTALTAGLTPNGQRGLWFAQGATVSAAAQNQAGAWEVQAAELTAAELAPGALKLASISPAPNSAGEVWVSTGSTLWSFTEKGWSQTLTPAAPRQLVAAGRTLWVQLGDALFRRDLDANAWARIQDLAAPPTFLAADATGSLWARVGADTVRLSAGVPLQVSGLTQNARVYEPELPIRVSFAADAGPTSVKFGFDDVSLSTLPLEGAQPGPAQTLVFSLGGVDVAGTMKPLSLAGLDDGDHTLRVVSEGPNGTQGRLVHFTFLGASTAVVSFATNIAPVSQARCAKCHTTGTLPELKTYEQWKANAEDIAQVVRDRRMPADGPLDAFQYSLIQRWVSGGATP